MSTQIRGYVDIQIETITNDQIAADAGIVYSKLDLAGSIVDADIVSIDWSKITGSPAGTIVVTTGSYADPAWITSLAGAKITGTVAAATLAAAATVLATPRTINGVAFDGSAAITVTAAAGTLTGATLAANVLASSLTSVGTLTGGATGAGFTVALGTSAVSGTLGVANGGTGLATLTAHTVYVGNGAAAPTALAVGATGEVLVGVTGANPVWTTTLSGLAAVTTSGRITSNSGIVVSGGSLATASISTRTSEGFCFRGIAGLASDLSFFNKDATTVFDVPTGTANVIFYGKLALGAITPTATLHIKAGTASANTAPLKFTSGPVLTTPEVGAFGFLTDDLFFTITTSAERKAFVLDDGARLTSGKIPIAFTNGRLIDGPTPLSGTKVYYVADASGIAVTRKLTFTNGILTAET